MNERNKDERTNNGMIVDNVTMMHRKYLRLCCPVTSPDEQTSHCEEQRDPSIFETRLFVSRFSYLRNNLAYMHTFLCVFLGYSEEVEKRSTSGILYC